MKYIRGKAAYLFNYRINADRRAIKTRPNGLSRRL
jgi:hypothetical protein